MTTRRVTSRKKAPILPAEMESARRKKARHLPMFGPGIVITIPLSLLPEYYELYGLEPLPFSEVVEREMASKKRKPAGVLWVKHAKNQENVNDEDLFVV